MIAAGNRKPTYDAAVATIHDHPSSPDHRVGGAPKVAADAKPETLRSNSDHPAGAAAGRMR
jgi:hypothetical protein